MRKSLSALLILLATALVVVLAADARLFSQLAGGKEGPAEDEDTESRALRPPAVAVLPPVARRALGQLDWSQSDEVATRLEQLAPGLSGHPGEALVRFGLGWALAAEKETARAGQELLSGPVLASPLSGAARTRVARLHEAEKQWEKALAAWNDVLADQAVSRFEGAARLGRTRALLEMDRGAEALREVEALEAYAPRVVKEDEILYLRARAYRASGRMERAHETLDGLYFHHPLSSWNSEASKLRWRADRAKTMDQTRALASDRWGRAEALFAAGRSLQASREYGVLEERHLGDVDVQRLRLRLGQCYLKLRRYKEAQGYLKSVGPGRPELHAEAVYHLGVLQRKQGQEEGFLRAMARAARLDGAGEWQAKAQLAVGSYWDEKEEIDSAKKAYLEAAGLADAWADGAEALWRLGRLEFRTLDFADARDHLLRYYDVARYEHEKATSLYWAARSEEARGQPEAARELFERARLEFPNDFYGERARQQLGLPPAPLAREDSPPPGPDRLAREIREAEAILGPGAEAALVRLRLFVALRLFGEGLAELEWLEDHGGESPVFLALKLDMAGLAGEHLTALRTFRKLYPDYRSRLDISAAHWRSVYPRSFDGAVRSRAAENALDPDLLRGLIHQESVFDSDARSRAGARGLMQIMPRTGAEIARKLGDTDYKPSVLYDPERNVRYGAFYLRELLDTFDGRPELALAGYNAGGGRVRKWVRNGEGADPDRFVESIPFRETRNYVKRVLLNQSLYQRLYAQEAER